MDSLEPELLHTATRFPSSFLGVAKIDRRGAEHASTRVRTEIMQPIVIRSPIRRCGICSKLGNSRCQQACSPVDDHVVDPCPLHRPRARSWCQTVASKFGILLVVARQPDTHARV